MAVEPESYRAESAPSVPRSSTSGWEVLDTGMSVAAGAARGVAWLITKLYALLLIAGGLFVAFGLPVDGTGTLIGLVIAAYGAYILLGGRWIVY